jgi:hypothetical protein
MIQQRERGHRDERLAPRPSAASGARQPLALTGITTVLVDAMSYASYI